MVAGRTPIQTVHADFPHTASQWSLKSPHYANPGHRTRHHAVQRRSTPQTRSIGAWKRRSGDRLAATHSRRCNWRTLSMGEAHRGSWYRSCRTCPRASLRRRYDDCRGPSLLPRSATRRSAVLLPPLTPATPPLDFAMGLYEPRCPDPGLRRRVSRVPFVSVHACCAPYPAETHRTCTPDRSAMDMAFTVSSAARLSDCKHVEAAGFTLCCGPRAGSLLRGS